MLEADTKIPPPKWRQRQRSKRKFSLDLLGICAEIETRFKHEKDREHECDQAQHFSWPDADPGKKGQRFFGYGCNLVESGQIIARYWAAEIVLRAVSAVILRQHRD